MAAQKQTEKDGDIEIAWQVVSNLDEQRAYPRIELETSVAFRNAAGQHCVARLMNISPDGIQVRCNVATAQILHPGGGKVCEKNAPIVQTAIAVPVAGGKANLSVCSKLAYVTTVPEEPRCVIGLQFMTPRPKAQKIIDRFFSDRLREYYVSDEPQRRPAVTLAN